MLTTQSTDVSGYVSMWPVFLSRGRAMCVCAGGKPVGVPEERGERAIEFVSFKLAYANE